MLIAWARSALFLSLSDSSVLLSKWDLIASAKSFALSVCVSCLSFSASVSGSF